MYFAVFQMYYVLFGVGWISEGIGCLFEKIFEIRNENFNSLNVNLIVCVLFVFED